MKKIIIEQKDGKITVYRNDEIDWTYDCNRVVERIQDGRMSAIGLANNIAEIIHDSLNCQNVKSKLTDANGTGSYNGTYFEYLEYTND